MSDPDSEPEPPGFSSQEAAALRSVGCQRKVPAQTILCQEGAATRSFFVLTSGKVEIGKIILGQPVALRDSGPGSVLGLMPAFDGSPCSVSIRTLEETTFIEVTPESLIASLQNNSETCIDLGIALTIQAIRGLRRSTDDLALAIYRALRAPKGPAVVVDLAQVQAGNIAWLAA